MSLKNCAVDFPSVPNFHGEDCSCKCDIWENSQAATFGSWKADEYCNTLMNGPGHTFRSSDCSCQFNPVIAKTVKFMGCHMWLYLDTDQTSWLTNDMAIIPAQPKVIDGQVCLDKFGNDYGLRKIHLQVTTINDYGFFFYPVPGAGPNVVYVQSRLRSSGTQYCANSFLTWSEAECAKVSPFGTDYYRSAYPNIAKILITDWANASKWELVYKKTGSVPDG